MRAEVSASLCSPEERPVSLKLDPVKLDTRLSGTPSISADPIEVELPEITVTVPEITVELPSPTLNVTLGVGDSGVVEYLEGVRAFIQSLQLGSVDPPELPDPTDVALAAAALLAIGPDVIRAIALPKLELEAELELGDLKISADDSLTIDTGRVRLHGVPVDDDVLPVKIAADLDNGGMTAVLESVRAALTGCLVLNGGDPPPAPCAPTAAVLKAKAEVDTNQKWLVRDHRRSRVRHSARHSGPHSGGRVPHAAAVHNVDRPTDRGDLPTDPTARGVCGDCRRPLRACQCRRLRSPSPCPNRH